MPDASYCILKMQNLSGGFKTNGWTFTTYLIYPGAPDNINHAVRVWCLNRVVGCLFRLSWTPLLKGSWSSTHYRFSSHYLNKMLGKFGSVTWTNRQHVFFCGTALQQLITSLFSSFCFGKRTPEV